MPQLNPSPWFFIFIFTWFVFLVFMMPKVLAHTFPHKLSTQAAMKPSSKPWNWPW